MRILHIITSLETGGAQRVLIQLLMQLQEKGHIQSVICMKPNGELSQQITDMGIPLHYMPFQPGTLLRSRSKCELIISTFQPEIIQSWLYHADFLTLFLRNQKKTPIIWGIHHSIGINNQNRLKLSTKIIVRLNAWFSHIIPQKIICCSKSTLLSHSLMGYAESKLVYIPNGIDVNQFKPDPQARESLRMELGLTPDTQLIGYIARYHPQKDHATFFNAANLLLEQFGNTHFLLAGDQVVAANPEIRSYMLSIKNSSHFHFLGLRTDIPRITAGLDVATLSSSGEALPLTILEAMACEIPSVATNVGDVEDMVGSCGIIVPSQNPKALADGWMLILNKNPLERAVMGRSARDRVMNYFTNEAMIKHYIDVYNAARSV